jgi:hypothetical protein
MRWFGLMAATGAVAAMAVSLHPAVPAARELRG